MDDDALLDEIARFLNREDMMPKTQASPPQRKRCPRHLEIRSLRETVRQLELLRDDLMWRQCGHQEVAPKVAGTHSYSMMWKQITGHQLSLREEAIETNLQSRRSIEDYSSLIARVKRQINQQEVVLRPRAELQIAHADNNDNSNTAEVYAELRASIPRLLGLTDDLFAIHAWNFKC